MERTHDDGLAIRAAHYFAGILGASILRHWYRDGTFNEARFAELDALFANRDEFPHDIELRPLEHDLLDGYAKWAATYDGPNPLIAAEEPLVHALLSPLVGPGTRALDAACGTGRYAEFFAERGCDVVGADQSTEMLAVARTKVPGATFHHTDLRSLPIETGSIDVAVCALALCHFDDPGRPVEEIARVVRPGGTVVITDPHPSAATLGGQAFFGGIAPGEPMRWVRNHYHGAATWLRAFRGAGLEVVDCQEPEFAEVQATSTPAYLFYPEASRAACEGLPGMWVWELRRSR